MFIFRLLLVVFAGAIVVHSGFVPAPSSRIVGGFPAGNVNLPFVVSLVTRDFHICGGSIISARTIVTAAHCLTGVTPHRLKVHVGDKSRHLTEGTLVPVKALHSHQRFTETTMDYDVGLVRLARDLIFSATIKPIQLPQQDDVIYPGSSATVAGWGYLNPKGPIAENLQYARVPIISQATCSRLLGGMITPRMICAGYLEGGKDACQMDSGGPLVLQGKLIGIVSWGIGCALPNKPGVYARVSTLVPWIRNVLKKEYHESI